MTTYVLLVALLVVTTNATGAVPMNEQHSADVIQYLWWVVGVFGLGIVSISGGISVWAIKLILKHDKEITYIKAGCVGHKKRSTDIDDEE